jgi:hypothetical protein
MKINDNDIVLFESRLKTLSNSTEIKKELSSFSRMYSPLELINEHLKKLTSHELFPPKDYSENKISIFNNDMFELSVFFNFQKGEYFKGEVLYSYTSDVYYCPLLDVNNSKYYIYSQTHTKDETILNNNFGLILEKEDYLKKGETIYLKKFKNIIRFDKTKPFIAYALTSNKNSLDFSWEYDAKSLKPIRIVLYNQNLGRLKTSIEILTNIGDIHSINLVTQFCSHKSHFIRWKAVNSLINIDYEKGIDILKSMISDSHPEIQLAAKKSLELLNIKYYG